MDIQLIQGEFSSVDTIELIAAMMQIKIKYHENKIASNSNEEDIKWREAKIKRIQKEMHELRTHIQTKQTNLKLDAVIKISQV